MDKTNQRWADCYVRIEGDRVIAGNARLERAWTTEDGWPASVSLLDKARGEEWLAVDSRAAQPDRPPGIFGERRLEAVRIDCREDDEGGLSRPHLRADIDWRIAGGDRALRLSLWLYPQASFMRQRFEWLPVGALGKAGGEGMEDEKESGTTGPGLADGGTTDGVAADRDMTAFSAAVAAAALSSPPAAVPKLDANNRDGEYRGAAPCIERLVLRERHARWECVRLSDRTDTTNNLVDREHGLLYVNERRALRGNVMLVNGTLRPCGLLLLKEGPAHAAVPEGPDADYRFEGLRLEALDASWQIADSGDTADRQADEREASLLPGENGIKDEYGIESRGTGADEANAEPAPLGAFACCILTVGVYDGSVYGAYALLHDYHRAVRVFMPVQDAFIMSNTWGDRSKDSRVTEAFVARELQAAAALGIDVCQIDDGWQKGVTVNSVLAESTGEGRWGDYYSGGGDFWRVHPERFPRGLAPVVELAAQLGVRLGLWYSPDAAGHYANWRRDAATLLELHRTYGIGHFKLDGIDLVSSTGTCRLLELMRTVACETRGAVRFNLDMTAQRRLGYYASAPFGNLFLENRYTDWGNYYPHWTLRNLWSLAPYVPVQSLQAEFLNVSRNAEAYADDPLSPAACGLAYAFGVTAFASPLAWMELSSLNEKQSALLAAILKAIRPHREAIAGGHILPLGDEPTGTGWTGLQSIAEREDSDGATSETGYLLIVRERNNEHAKPFRLWGQGADELRLRMVVRLRERDAIELGSDSGTEDEFIVQADERGEFRFALPAPLTFAIYRYEKN